MATSSWAGRICFAGGLLAGLVCAEGVLGNGISVDEMSVRRLGDAFSGGAAEAADASAVWYNPAAITQLKQREVSGGFIAIPHETRFDGQVVFTDPISGGPVDGHNKTWTGTELIPNVYSALPVSDRLWLGFGVNSPWGTGTKFDKHWVGRYQSIGSELLTINLLGVVGYQLTDKFSIGGGVVAEYADGKVERAIQFSEDGRFKSNGNDISIGFMLGLHYQPMADWQFGMNYRSAIKHTLEGDMEVTLPGGAQVPAIGADYEKVGGCLKLDIPETFSLSAIHAITPEWSIKADATWVRWSRFGQLKFKPKSTGKLIEQAEVQDMDWHDVWRFALGTEYQLNPAWAIRAGVAYDGSPTPNHTATVDFAVGDYRALSVGATWIVSPSLAVDMAFQHTWTSRRTIHETVEDIGKTGNIDITADGEVTNRINSIGVGVRWSW